MNVFGGICPNKLLAGITRYLLEQGADILELGFPFSDPVADGPLIQEASERSLEKGTTLLGTIELAGRIREKRQAPILLMGYANPVYHMGYEAFAENLAAAGGDGAIIPDLPSEAAGPLRESMGKNGLALIPMAAPNTPPDRLSGIIDKGSGFLYLVSMAGLTGDAIRDGASWRKVAAMARENGRLPVCIGFGIRTAQDAERAAEVADGVIVGTAITKCIMDAADTEEARRKVGDLVRELAGAINKR